MMNEDIIDVYMNPKDCGECGLEDSVEYADGEYVCGCCGWTIDAFTGKIIHTGTVDTIFTAPFHYPPYAV